MTEQPLAETKSNLPAMPNLGPIKGMEEPTQREDLIIPRANLLQALSPEVVENPKEFYPGLIINSLTKEELPEVFIPIFKFTEWIKFNPKDKKDPNFDQAFEPGALIYKTSDPHDPIVAKEGSFGPNGEKPTITKFLNFFSYFPGHNMPVVVSFCKTSLLAGKQLGSLIQFSGDPAAFCKQYSLKAKQVSNDQFTWNIFVVKQAGVPLPTDYKIAESWYSQFKNKPIEVHQEAQPQEAEE